MQNFFLLNLWFLVQKGSCGGYRQRGIVGDCLAEFAKAFPVAFLEPEMTIYNKQSILNNKDFKRESFIDNYCESGHFDLLKLRKAGHFEAINFFK